MKNGTILRTVTLIMTTVFHKMSFNQCILSVHEGKKAFEYCMYLWLKCSWKWKSIQHLALPVHEGNKPFVIITFWFPQHMRVRTICVFICDYKCSKSNIWIKTLHWISSLWQKMILLSNLWLQIGQILTKDRID